MKSLSLIFVLTMLLVGVGLAQTKDEKTKAAIRKVMDEQAAAWNRGDIESFMQGYWKSPELKFVSGDNVTKGWQPTLDRYKINYDSRAKMGVLTFSGLEINTISKDAAVVLGNWALQREGDNPKGKFTLIFRKFNDGWKIVHDHTS
jgi:ketosteroid isomerase-like protein